MEQIKNMKAFNNDPTLKRELLEIAAQQDTSFGFFPVCKAKWPSVNAYFNYEGALEEKLKIPALILHFEGLVFNGVSEEIKNSWTIDFLESIETGVDLSPVIPRLLSLTLDKIEDDDTENKFNSYISLLRPALDEWIEVGDVNFDFQSKEWPSSNLLNLADAIGWRSNGADEAMTSAASGVVRDVFIRKGESYFDELGVKFLTMIKACNAS